MTDRTFPDLPEFEDGISTILVTEKEEEMSEQIDLPPNVASQMLADVAGNVSANAQSGRALSTAAMGSLQAGIAKTHNELGPAESRAISGVIATPVAGPTTQAQ